MNEKQNESVAKIHEKSKKLISELSELKKEIVAIQNSSLAISEHELETIEALKKELGLTEKVGTWPICGPGNVSCHWCTAGSGA